MFFSPLTVADVCHCNFAIIWLNSFYSVLKSQMKAMCFMYFHWLPSLKDHLLWSCWYFKKLFFVCVSRGVGLNIVLFLYLSIFWSISHASLFIIKPIVILPYCSRCVGKLFLDKGLHIYVLWELAQNRLLSVQVYIQCQWNSVKRRQL